MRKLLLLSLLAGTVTGCQATDPYNAPGHWRPRGANDANLRAMLADPAHLDRGASSPRAEGQMATQAVGRLRQGRVRPLPASGVARINSTGSGDGNAAQ
ncbi:hypothetical protein [Roseomonas sp. BN140053]|uniref:hypothetical protein n=1 Tax=Roseomonas sp. BN140053 TaxID=3391898 RepID=UPI0039E7C7D5